MTSRALSCRPIGRPAQREDGKAYGPAARRAARRVTMRRARKAARKAAMPRTDSAGGAMRRPPLHESVAAIHPEAGRDLAADGGDFASRPARLSLHAAVGAAASRFSDHPGADAVSGREPRSDEPVGVRASVAAVRSDAGLSAHE